MMPKEEKSGRAKALAYLIGAGAAKSALSEVPKATIEKVVEGAALRKMQRQSMRGAFKASKALEALRGRALGRAAGGVGVGALTFPVFISGVKDIKTGDKERQAAGVAKIIGSGLLYSGWKGGVEYAIEKALAGKKVSARELGPVFKKAFTARAIPGVGAAALTAASIGYGLRKKESLQNDGKGRSRLLVPLMAAAAGGLTSAAKQIPESVYVHAKGPARWSTYSKVLRNKKLWLPRTIGRGVAGAFGAGILGAIVDRVLSKKD